MSYNARRISEPGNSSYEMLESKQQRHHTASTTDDRLSIMKPEPSLVPLNSFREYNPSTFSAQLRGSRISDPPFSPFRDLESGGSRSPPFSPYHDTPPPPISPVTGSPRFPPRSDSAQFSPYTDSPSRSPASERGSGNPAYPQEVRIGLAK